MNSLPPGTVHLQSVGGLLESLESYQAPLEIRRAREALELWRPLYEELLECVELTVEQTWPFQVYPPIWRERSSRVVIDIDEALAQEVDCHFPQQSHSNLRLLHRLVTCCLQDPQSLTGREVGLARQILLDSTKKWGPLGSEERRASLFARGSLPDELGQLRAQLRALPPHFGWSDMPASTPRHLRKRVNRARQAAPHELIEQGVIKNLADLARVSPQLLAQCEGQRGALAFEFAAQLTQLCWDHFPWEAPNRALLSVRDQLLQVGGRTDAPKCVLAWSSEAEDVIPLMRWMEPHLNQTLYSRYYGVSMEDDLGLMPPRRRAEIQQLLCAVHTFYGLQLGVRPTSPLSSATTCWRYCGKLLGDKLGRSYQRLLRHRKIAQAWQNLVFFLGLCEAGEREQFLTDALGAPWADLRRHAGQLQRVNEGLRPQKVLLQWVESEDELVDQQP